MSLRHIDSNAAWQGGAPSATHYDQRDYAAELKVLQQKHAQVQAPPLAIVGGHAILKYIDTRHKVKASNGASEHRR